MGGPLSRGKPPRVQADSSHQHGRGSRGPGRAGNALPAETSYSSAEATPNVTPGGAAGRPQGQGLPAPNRPRGGRSRGEGGFTCTFAASEAAHHGSRHPTQATPRKGAPSPGAKLCSPLPEPEVAPAGNWKWKGDRLEGPGLSRPGEGSSATSWF